MHCFKDDEHYCNKAKYNVCIITVNKYDHDEDDSLF